jgi:hypothetical protein
MLIYNAMRVAAILHNRLLIYDGYDKFDWETCDPDEDEPENLLPQLLRCLTTLMQQKEQWLQENLHRESFLSILSVPKRTQFHLARVTIGR